MSLSRIRNIKNDNLTWPGFVDALAALLMVVIFVLMIFSIAQFYLNQIVSGQDEALFDLNKEINCESASFSFFLLVISLLAFSNFILIMFI